MKALVVAEDRPHAKLVEFVEQVTVFADEFRPGPFSATGRIATLP